MYQGSKTVLVSYADERFKNAQRINVWAGKHLGKFDRVVAYGPEDIEEKFYLDNKMILSMQRGAGLWLWKPYIIFKQLEQLNDGDFLFYCDSGAFMLKNCKYIIDSMQKEEIWISDIPLIEEQWTKPQVFKEFGISESEGIKSSNQIQAGFIGIRKTAATVEFIKQWLQFCCDPNLLLPIADGEDKGNCIAHREDQSILSVLCKLKGVCPHRDPTQFGKIPELIKRNNAIFSVPVHPEDKYPVLINLHRTKGQSFIPILKQLLFAVLPRQLVLAYKKMKYTIHRMNTQMM